MILEVDNIIEIASTTLTRKISNRKLTKFIIYSDLVLELEPNKPQDIVLLKVLYTTDLSNRLNLCL